MTRRDQSRAEHALGTVVVFVCALLAVSAVAAGAHARPVSSATTTTVEVVAGAEEFHGELRYSFTPRFALGAGYQRHTLRDDVRFEAVQPDVNFLLWRRNSAVTQSNLYLTAGYGAARIGGVDWTHGGSGRLGIDSESRRWMVGVWGGAGAYVDGTFDPYGGAMAGLAPYLGDYNAVQAWVMVTADYLPERLRSYDVTPHIRLMYRSALVELGASFRGEYRLRFVVDF